MVILKPRELEEKIAEYSYIGKRIPRVDARKKVTGQAEYFGDVKLPRMLTGKILTSPHPHAKVVNIDTSKAERLSGVRVAATSKDMPFCLGWLASSSPGLPL